MSEGLVDGVVLMELTPEDDRVPVLTEARVPFTNIGRPDDVVPMVLLLASPLSSWTTGQVVSVNGGYAMV